MAIEIERRTEINKLLWPIAFLVFSLVVSTTLLVSYFYFDSAYNELFNNLVEKQKGLVKTAEEKALEDSLTGYQNKINIFGKIFEDHRKVVNILSFIEKTCHPSVYFSDISYDVKTGETSLDGTAADFMTVSQQVIIFKEQKDIVKKVSLKSLAPSENGDIGFSLTLTIDPNITLMQTQQ
ncbi:MAG: hypothetical protein NTW46_02725 [Candidatus Nealsonbacteria bacterium]|nr:hypothetical protein [Candidatus Nealsonbacteria bacterium]